MKKIEPKKAIVLFLLIVYFLLAASKYKIFQKPSKNPISSDRIQARCLRVVDGDTIEVAFIGENKLSETKEKIRFIGVNTPELNTNNGKKAEYWAKEATAFTKKELEGKYIELSFDDVSSKKDKYERFLCYVWIDDYLFNKILLESGNAYYYPNFKFNKKYMTLFEQAENYARNEKAGLWNE